MILLKGSASDIKNIFPLHIYRLDQSYINSLWNRYILQTDIRPPSFTYILIICKILKMLFPSERGCFKGRISKIFFYILLTLRSFRKNLENVISYAVSFHIGNKMIYQPVFRSGKYHWWNGNFDLVILFFLKQRGF